MTGNTDNERLYPNRTEKHGRLAFPDGGSFRVDGRQHWNDHWGREPLTPGQVGALGFDGDDDLDVDDTLTLAQMM